MGTRVYISVGAESSPVKVDDHEVCKLSDLDWPCVVNDVNGTWVWIGDTQFEGWVKRSDVVTIDEALKQRSEALRREPSAANFNNRGNAWFSKGKLDFAIKDYDEAIRLKPTDGIYYYNRGEAWLQKGDAKPAISDLTEAIRRSDNNRPAQYDNYLLRGIAYYRLGDRDAALADHREAERIKQSLLK